MLEKRSSGILLHISSLPSSFGIGDLGPEAMHFVDFLHDAKQSYWQILPVNPTDGVYHHSPYSSNSAFAGNILLISPEMLVRQGWLKPADIKVKPLFSNDEINYKAVVSYKRDLLNLAYLHNKERLKEDHEYREFCKTEEYWLDDYALFVVLKNYFAVDVWTQWPKDVEDRDKKNLDFLRKELREPVEKHKFFQYLFFCQWRALRDYCDKRKIKIIGDIPIYVNDDSVDVWANQTLFKLNEKKEPIFVAGVPPDYFSKTGQRWGNPVYNWDILKQTGFGWWIKRLKHNLKLFDAIRIDHFRGLVEYWEIDSKEETALNGHWVTVPKEEFFQTVLNEFPNPPVIAEDLGIITDEVRETMKQFGFPGMKILLFAFDGDVKEHPYIPENYSENCVVYTGTHDNNTVRGWFEKEVSPETKEKLFSYLGKRLSADEISWTLIRLAFQSKAKLALIPLQDVLGLGAEARMNTPATTEGNWKWRFPLGLLDSELSNKLASLTRQTHRE
jgi:4-alpha-glucanotransferase